MNELLELYVEEILEKSSVEYDPFGYIEEGDQQTLDLEDESIIEFDWDDE